MSLTAQEIERIRLLKQTCGMTNREISAIVGISEATVQRYINGDVKEPSIESLRALIVAMGGNPDDILGDKEDENEDGDGDEEIGEDEMTERAASIPGIATYERMILAMEERHRAEIERINSAHERAREAMIAEHRDAIKEKRRWQIAHVIIIGILVAFIMLLFLIDVTNPDVGWFRDALNSIVGAKDVLVL